jgi:peptidoglycan hydrolase-like protein with peptidoglycan-binding domain
MGYTEVGEADGVAGSKFTKAVKRMQKEKGKTQDGEITKCQVSWKILLGIIK